MLHCLATCENIHCHQTCEQSSGCRGKVLPSHHFWGGQFLYSHPRLAGSEEEEEEEEDSEEEEATEEEKKSDDATR
jgi:hypothetical protein